MKTTSLLSAVLCLCAGPAAAGQLRVWSLSKTASRSPAQRTGWTRVDADEARRGSVAVESDRLTVVVAEGAPGPVLHTPGQPATRVELAVLSPDKTAGAVSAVSIAEPGAADTTVRFACGKTEAELQVTALGPFVRLKPRKGAAHVEITVQARYVMLPDFFGDDVIYDPRRLKRDALTVPAENFLLSLPAGGRTIVASVWPGNLKKKDALEQKVDILLAGKNGSRHVRGHRIELLGRPVHIAVMERKDLWHDLDISKWDAYTPRAIDWTPPFAAKWRADFVVAEGKVSADWMTQSQSFPMVGPITPGDKQWFRKSKTYPTIWQEAIGHIICPAWLQGGKAHVCVYADGAERRKERGHTRAERRKAQAAKKKGETYTPKPFRYANNYERVIVYPIDRTKKTPLDAWTLTDVMRQTLGTGPCEYVLDVAGVKARPDGGTRKLLAGATCPLWDHHIFPILSRDVRRLTPGAKLPDDKQKHLIRALEDMMYFVHAVHDRIREYRSFADGMAKFCDSDAARSGPVKPLAAKIKGLALALRRTTGLVDRKGKTGETAEQHWDDQVKLMIEQAKTGRYKLAGTVAKIRGLGNQQDQAVARCRRYVKAMRQEAALADSADPAAAAFALRVRKMCQSILRNKHRKEGW